MESVLCKIKSVNKTDVITLVTNFKSLSGIAAASIEDLVKCPGIAKLKAERIYEAFRKPIKITTSITDNNNTAAAEDDDDDDDDDALILEKDDELEE